MSSEVLSIIADAVQSLGDRASILSKLTLQEAHPVSFRGVISNVHFSGTISGDLGTDQGAGKERYVTWQPYVANLERDIIHLDIVAPTDLDNALKRALSKESEYINLAPLPDLPSWWPDIHALNTLQKEIGENFVMEYIEALPGGFTLKRNFKNHSHVRSTFQAVEFELLEVKYIYESAVYRAYVDFKNIKYFGPQPIDSSVKLSWFATTVAVLAVIGGGVFWLVGGNDGADRVRPATEIAGSMPTPHAISSDEQHFDDDTKPSVSRTDVEGSIEYGTEVPATFDAPLIVSEENAIVELSVNVEQPFKSKSMLVVGVDELDVLNIRFEPQASSRKIGEIPHDGSALWAGDEVPVGNYFWYKVEYDGITGWVNSKYLQESVGTYNAQAHSQVIEELANQATIQDQAGGMASAPATISDRDAQPIQPPTPTFPQRAAERGIEGRCDVRFDVDTQGRPYNIQANCTNNMFKAEAERAVAIVEFVPKIIHGKAEERKNVVYPLEFKLN